jgi:diamine N-acetyltransferase
VTARPVVALTPLTPALAEAVVALEVAPDQRGFVATNRETLAQADAYGDAAWVGAVTADGVAVGLVALYSAPPRPPLLWRLMIDAGAQGRGVGREAVALVIAEVRRRWPGADTLTLSHAPGAGNPGPFYERLGFRYTGAQKPDGQVVMALDLVGVR